MPCMDDKHDQGKLENEKAFYFLIFDLIILPLPLLGRWFYAPKRI